MKTELPMITKRECGACTKCCEGYLIANIRGIPIGNGKPCMFVDIGKGCKDYENRPQDPCKSFECGWIAIDEMPEEFKPSISGVIMTRYKNNGNPYIRLNKAPNNPTEQYLTWAVIYAVNNNYNLIWAVDNKNWWIGNENFLNQMMVENP